MIRAAHAPVSWLMLRFFFRLLCIIFNWFKFHSQIFMFKWDGFGVLFSISTGTKKSGSKKFKQQRWTLSMYKKTEKSDEKEARTKKNRVALQAARQPFGRSINVSQENVRRTERYVSSSNFVPRRLQHIGAVAVATLSLEGCGCSFSAGFPAGG